ncbi:rod shape-determining protein MreC [Rickettsiella grylli]|nr:rod shape-determining protein MreC [Rickettsiella grylli]
MSLLLILLDYHHYLFSLRRLLNNVVAPLQYTVDAPIHFFHTISRYFVMQRKLQTENTALRGEQVVLLAKLQRYAALESENRQLNQLLAATEHLKKQHFRLARLLRVNADPLLNEVIVDKGQSEGIKVGQPVLDANGVMGQVISVNFFNSRVLLLTDFRSAIPVQDVRSDARGILVGRGRIAKLLLKDIPDTVDIKVNDLLVTSGLGGRYPAGYPVGIVSTINTNVATPFASIQVDPSTQLNRNRPVVIISPVSDSTAFTHSKAKASSKTIKKVG